MRYCHSYDGLAIEFTRYQSTLIPLTNVGKWWRVLVKSSLPYTGVRRDLLLSEILCLWHGCWGRSETYEHRGQSRYSVEVLEFYSICRVQQILNIMFPHLRHSTGDALRILIAFLPNRWARSEVDYLTVWQCRRTKKGAAWQIVSSGTFLRKLDCIDSLI